MGQDDCLKSPFSQRLVRVTADRLQARRKPEAVSEMAAPTWIEHQRAPGSRHEPTKSADGSKVKGWGWKGN